MEYTRVGKRGYLFTFTDPYRVNVYAVDADEHLFICDTYLGIEPMKDVLGTLRDAGIDKPVIVFLSHADYDHIWGNGAFKNTTIIAHKYCHQRIQTQAADDLERFKTHKRGTVEIVEPNLLFNTGLEFPRDGIRVYHTPAHTRDSSSLIDTRDLTIFVGDNIEHPFPFINDSNFEEFKSSLQSYLDYNPLHVVSGHDPAMNNTRLIEENLSYIKSLQELAVDTSSFDERMLGIHANNLFTVAENSQDGKQAYYESALSVLELLPESDRIKSMTQKITQELGR